MEKLILKYPGAHPGLSSEASSDPSTSDNALTAAAANVSSSISPTRLSQKHHEIMYAIKIHNWDTVRKSLEHNEYLAEMSDALTGQLLLHQIALHGSNAPVLLIDLIYDRWTSRIKINVFFKNVFKRIGLHPVFYYPINTFPSFFPAKKERYLFQTLDHLRIDRLMLKECRVGEDEEVYRKCLSW